MNKKLIAILLVGMLVFAGCNTKKEQNTVNFTMDKETYTLDDNFSYTIEVLGDATYSFGSDYIVEVKDGENWKVYNDMIPSTMEMNYSSKEMPYTFNRELKISDIIEEAGTYRLLKHVNNVDTEKSLEITAEFTVSE